METPSERSFISETMLPSAAAAAAEEGPEFRPGQRVHMVGSPRRIETVRYVGRVDGYEGMWVGVDWDNGEGKHDGTVGGVRYFTATGDRSGSLVRPKSLIPGISLLNALYLRYRGHDSTKEEEDEMYVLSTSNKRVSIQLVGKHKVQQKLDNFEELLSASLSFLGISSVGPPHGISAVLPNLKELDLTGSLLSKWQDIGAICDALPALEVLNLTNNLMESEISEHLSLRTICILILNNCGISWKQVEKLEESLPGIEELHLMSNKLRTIMIEHSPVANFVQGFNTLRLLNLEDNYINSWDEILKFSCLRSLEQLHLNKNNLKKIYYPATEPELQDNSESQDRCFNPFQRLQCLLLGCNEIDELASVDSLNLFPNLMDIRLSENPVADPAKGGIPRFVLIARLEKIKVLNGSEVLSYLFCYVRLVMANMQSSSLDDVKRLHPRYAELQILHGIADEKASGGMVGPQKMASGPLCITLKCVGASLGEKLPLTKRLPASTPVGKLKALCESFFDLKGIMPRLFLQEEGSPLPELLNDDMARLVDLGINTGATILLDEES